MSFVRLWHVSPYCTIALLPTIAVGSDILHLFCVFIINYHKHEHSNKATRDRNKLQHRGKGCYQ